MFFFCINLIQIQTNQKFLICATNWFNLFYGISGKCSLFRLSLKFFYKFCILRIQSWIRSIFVTVSLTMEFREIRRKFFCHFFRVLFQVSPRNFPTYQPNVHLALLLARANGIAKRQKLEITEIFSWKIGPSAGLP